MAAGSHPLTLAPAYVYILMRRHWLAPNFFGSSLSLKHPACTFDSRFSSFCPLGKQKGLCKIYRDLLTSSPGPSASFYLLIGIIIGWRREHGGMLSGSWL